MSAALPGGRHVRNRLIAYTAVIPLFAVVLISLYLTALLRLSHEQWVGFAQIVALLFVVLLVAVTRVNGRLYRPIERCLDRLVAGDAGPDDVREGFAAIANFPRSSFVSGLVFWPLGGTAVGLAMYARYTDFSAFSALVMLLAGSSGGVVSMVFFLFLIKRYLEPVRNAVAAQIPEPALRRGLVRGVSLKHKLLVSITAVTMVTAIFAVCLAHVRTQRAVEQHAARLQRHFLQRALGAGVGAAASPVAAARALPAPPALGHRLALIDPDTGRIVDGSPDALTAAELRAIRHTDTGDSTGFDSPNVLAWTRLPGDRRILVSVVPWEEASLGIDASRGIFGLLLLISAALAVGIAYLAADDVSRTTDALRAQATRVASGDLTRGAVFETEDELGELARAFESMSGALRSMVAELVGTADRVETAAADVARLTGDVVRSSAEQAGDIDRTRAAVADIFERMQGIAGSAQGLTETAEESSSSILELGVASRELNQNASVLSDRVEEVSNSIEDLVRSVREVGRSTEGLSGAAEQTSASMEQMASSVHEVNVAAGEVSTLAGRMVETAERGRQRVGETIRGMDAIRDATSTAERVIHGLGARSEEIGAILNVIEEVADETGLLALNAAIIAAQAGENGRAFSVVADEIKDLADRVLRSTKEIGDVIRAVQEESTRAIGAIERGAQSVQSGVELSADAGVSLEEITAAARESGGRIEEIVSAMREQTKSANHVVSLMERVSGGVESIRAAGLEQDRGHEIVLRGTNTMREVAVQVLATTEEQAHGFTRIREGSESVRESVERINETLQEQRRAFSSGAELLERVYTSTRSNEKSAASIGDAMRELRERARRLREGVQRFRI